MPLRHALVALVLASLVSPAAADGTVELDQVDIYGGPLKVRQIKRAVRALRKKLAACRLPDDPSGPEPTSRTAYVVIDIAGDGTVATRPSTEPATADTACLDRTLATLRLPARRAQTSALLTLRFEPPDPLALEQETAIKFAEAIIAASDTDDATADRWAPDQRTPGADLAANAADSDREVALGSGAGGSRGDGDPRIGIGPTGPRFVTAVKIDDGDRTDEAVSDAIAMRHDDLLTCYRTALRRDPDLAADLELAVTIAADGAATIRARTVTSSTSTRPSTRTLSRCVVGRALKHLTLAALAAAGDPTTATVTLTFSPD